MSYALFLVFVALTFLRPFDLFFPETAEYRPMLLLMLACLLVTLATPSCRKAAARGAQPLGLVLLIWVMAVVSLLANGLIGVSIDAAVSFAPSIITFIVTLMNVDGLKRLKTTCAVTALSVLAMALISLYAYYTGFMGGTLITRQLTNTDLPFDFREELKVAAEDDSGLILYRIRSVGFMNDPNDFSQTMIMVLPLLAALYQPAHRARSFLVIGFASAILLYAIHLTHSRGAILGVGALVLLALRQKLGNVLSITLLAVGGAVGVAMGLGGERGFSASEESAGDRISAWAEGLSMLRQNPIFGVGYGRFDDFNPLTAHNTFVLCFAELGLVGFFIWMGLLVVGVKSLIRAREVTRPQTEEHRWAGLVLASVIGFLVCGFFLSRTYAVTYYLLMALSVCVWHSVREGLLPDAASGAARPIRWAGESLFLVVATIAGIFAIVRMKSGGVL